MKLNAIPRIVVQLFCCWGNSIEKVQLKSSHGLPNSLFILVNSLVFIDNSCLRRSISLFILVISFSCLDFSSTILSISISFS